MAETLSFYEKTNAWTSRWGYNPECMTRLNRSFFSFKKGQLYVHHSETAPRNYFYDDNGDMGVQESSVTLSFNQDPSDIKHFKTISLESNTKKWDVEIETNLDSGHINWENFDTREGEHYASISRNSSSLLDFTHLSIQGLGGVDRFIGSNGFEFKEEPSFLSTEDTLYSIDGDGNPLEMGKIQSFNKKNVYVYPVINRYGSSNFHFVAKSPAAESNGLKGNHAKVRLTTTDSANEATLFAVNTEVFKSFQ